jgi:hypothetical protein
MYEYTLRVTKTEERIKDINRSGREDAKRNNESDLIKLQCTDCMWQSIPSRSFT